MELRRYDYLIQQVLPALLLDGFKVRKDSNPAPGNLVMLSSAPQSEWHLSYYIKDCGDGYHLLESVKSGELMRWGNVGFHVLDEDRIGVGDMARWTDAQFNFHDKYVKACRKADFHMALPFIAGFDGDRVNITFRTRWGLDNIKTPIEPFHWSKITQKRLLSILIDGESTHKNRRRADDAEKEPTNDN